MLQCVATSLIFVFNFVVGHSHLYMNCSAVTDLREIANEVCAVPIDLSENVEEEWFNIKVERLVVKEHLRKEAEILAVQLQNTDQISRSLARQCQQDRTYTPLKHLSYDTIKGKQKGLTRELPGQITSTDLLFLAVNFKQ